MDDKRNNTAQTSTIPLVSIITPSFNQAPYIERTLTSVRSQDYPHIEHIVMDGGSSDGTVEILKLQSFAQWTSEPDGGQSHALNKGFARAQGQIIGWLNSDDMYTPGAVRRAVQALQAMPDAPFVYGAWDIVDDNDRVLEHRPAKRSEVAKLINPPPGVIPSQRIGQPTVFVRASALQAAGGIDERLHMCMDYDLLVRLSRLGPPAMVAATQALFRVTGTSKTSFTPPAMWAESFAVIARYGNHRKAHELFLPLFYYAVLRGQSPRQAHTELLVAIDKMQAAERELLNKRIVLGYRQWAEAASCMLDGNIGRAIPLALAACRTGALGGAKLLLLARGVWTSAQILLNRVCGYREPLEELLEQKTERRLA